LLKATVPTSSELTGNFSTSSIAGEGNPNATGGPPGTVNYTTFPGGQIPTSKIDANMVALIKTYPAANANPANTGGYNYVQAETFNQNNL